MKNGYKPSGYTSVSPYFVVDDAQKLVDLLTQLFNATELRRYDNPDGTIMHIELKIDDSVIMLGDSSQKFPSNMQLVHIYVPNVDEIFSKAISSGCVSLEPPNQRGEDPDKRGSFKDFAGNVWSIATQL